MNLTKAYVNEDMDKYSHSYYHIEKSGDEYPIIKAGYYNCGLFFCEAYDKDYNKLVIKPIHKAVIKKFIDRKFVKRGVPFKDE